MIIGGNDLYSQIIWERNPLKPVKSHWSGNIDDPNRFKYTIEPSILYDSVVNVYRFWFASLTYGYGTSISVSASISFEGVDWYTYFKNPVLKPTEMVLFSISMKVIR